MAVRNIEDLALEEITEEFLLDQAIEMGEELEVDTRQGSLYMDAAAGHIIRASKFFNDLRQVNDIISIYTCTGDVLDEKLAERGLQRNPPEATPATYYVEFIGAVPEIGDVVTCDGYFFKVDMLEERYVIISDDVGTEMNNLFKGSMVIPELDVDDLISATLLELAVPALDQEDDDSARERLINYISGPTENGNKTQIRSWCEAIAGVGRARIIPLWQGECTVLGIIIGSDGTKPTDNVVTSVQEAIDPDSEGMGEGLAAIGCHFTALAVEELPINISVSVSIQEGSTLGAVEEAIIAAVSIYLQDITFQSEEPIVRYSRIGSLISQTAGVIDYSDLLINGSANNVSCSIYQTPVVGEVSVDGDI